MVRQNQSARKSDLGRRATWLCELVNNKISPCFDMHVIHLPRVHGHLSFFRSYWRTFHGSSRVDWWNWSRAGPSIGSLWLMGQSCSFSLAGMCGTERLHGSDLQDLRWTILPFRTWWNYCRSGLRHPKFSTEIKQLNSLKNILPSTISR